MKPFVVPEMTFNGHSRSPVMLDCLDSLHTRFWSYYFKM